MFNGEILVVNPHPAWISNGSTTILPAPLRDANPGIAPEPGSGLRVGQYSPLLSASCRVAIATDGHHLKYASYRGTHTIPVLT
jgi:hypothetical protein